MHRVQHKTWQGNLQGSPGGWPHGVLLQTGRPVCHPGGQLLWPHNLTDGAEYSRGTNILLLNAL